MSRPADSQKQISITITREGAGGSSPPLVDVTCPLQLADAFAVLFLSFRQPASSFPCALSTFSPHQRKLVGPPLVSGPQLHSDFRWSLREPTLYVPFVGLIQPLEWQLVKSAAYEGILREGFRLGM